MSQSDQKVVHHLLGEARANEIGLGRTLKSQITTTPRGSYRDGLEKHLDETRKHARRIQERLAELEQGRNPRPAVVGFTETLIGQTVALSKASFDLLRGPSGEEKVLKNAKEACATEALEIATYTVLELLAIKVADERTAKLAASIRDDEDHMLQRIMRELPKLTDADVRAEVDRDQAAKALADRVCQGLLRRAKEQQPNHRVARHQRTAREAMARLQRTGGCRDPSRPRQAATQRTRSPTSAAHKDRTGVLTRTREERKTTNA